MSNQIDITGGARVRGLNGVITGTSGVLSSVPLGAANGVATLDSGGKVPVSQLPSSVVTYLGTWNAATNTPTLTNGVGDAGDMYICNVAGTVNFGAGPVTFAVGDWVLYGSGTWQKSSGQNGTVTSVAASITGNAIGLTGSPITTAGTLAFAFAGTSGQYVNGAGNLTTFPTLITSIGLSMPSAFSVANSPLTANGSINVTGAGSSAQYIDGTGSLQTFPSIISQAQNLVTEVWNESGATLTKGTVVYINGGHGNLPTITKALATSDATSAQTYGVVQADITNNNNGYVVAAGRLLDLDTQAYAAGTQLYLSSTTAGAWTSTKQYAPAHLVYVGIVVRSHPTQGVVEVKIQNGYELDELHNVSAQSPSNGNILQYVTSTGLWTAVAGTTTNIAEGTNLYYTDARARGALSFTAGSGAYNSTTGVITIPTNTSQLTNGANFITLASLSAGAGISYNNTTGVITSTITQYTDAMARAAISGGTGISYNSTTGIITNTITQYTDALARAAISLTTTGTSGAATYNSTTGVLNIPQYTDTYVGTVTSVALSAPTGFSVTGSPVTSSGTLALAFASGYSLPTNVKQSNWDDAYTWVAAFPTQTGNSGKFLTTDGSVLSWASNPLGTVTSVAMTVPTGLSVSGSPITTSGTLAVTFDSGYSIPTTASQSNWDTAYTNRITSATSPLSITSNVISISQATTSTSGYLSSTDWNTFNNKQAQLNGTGFVKASGTTITYDNSTYLTTSSAAFTYLALTGGTLTGALGGTSASFSSSVTATQFIIGADQQYKMNGSNSGYAYITSNVGFNSNYNGTAIISNPTNANSLSAWTLDLGGNDGINNEADGFTILRKPNGGSYSRLFTIASTGAATFSSSVTATSFIKTSGTSSQFLKADGSVDSTAYGTGTVTSVAALTLGTSGTDLSSSVATGTTTPVITLNVPTASATNRGALSSTDWTTFNNKQGALTLTTTGTSGAATLVGNTLNIPQYSGGGGSMAIGGSITSATAGSVLFVGSSADLQQNNAQFFWDNTNNRLGLGTASPQYTLDISTTTAFPMRIAGASGTGFLTSWRLDNSTNSAYQSFSFGGTVAGSISAFVNANILEAVPFSTGNFVLSAYSNSIVFATGTRAQLSYINSSGNWGLGTNTIGSKLQVNGNAAIGYSASTAAPTNGLAVNTGIGVGTNTATEGTQASTSLSLISNVATGSLIQFGDNGRIRPASTGARLSIEGNALYLNTVFNAQIYTGSGNIGINTTSTGSKLQVNGNVAIGYSASTAAPTNGLVVSGIVGIGTTSTKSYSSLTNNGQFVNLSNVILDVGQSYTFNKYYNSGTVTDRAVSTGYAADFYLETATGDFFIRSTSTSFTANTDISLITRFKLTSSGQMNLYTGANASAILQTGYSLTGANAQSLLDLAGTWNTTGNPTAIKLNITNTASGSTSNLMDLQVGGVSKFKVDKAGFLTSYNAFNTQTASYTLALTDASKIVEMNPSATASVTVPLNSSVAFPIGTEIAIFNYSNFTITIAAASGVTIRSIGGGLSLFSQYTGATLIKRGTDEWYLIGNV